MEQEFTFGGPIAWSPSVEQIEHTQLKQFMNAHGIATFAKLVERAGNDIAWFWNAVLAQLNVEFYEPYSTIVDLSDGPQWAHWCVGGKMNIAHNALDKWVTTPMALRLAIRWEGEEGSTR